MYTTKEIKKMFPKANADQIHDLLSYPQEQIKTMATYIWTPAMTEALRLRLNVGEVNDASKSGFMAITTVSPHMKCIYDELNTQKDLIPGAYRVERKEEMTYYPSWY